MGFCKVEAGRLCWIYPGGRLLPLPDIERTTLRHSQNLSYLPGDDEVVAPPAPPVPLPSTAGPSFSSQPPSPSHPDIESTLRSIQEEQAFLRAYVASKHAALREFVQERHVSSEGCLLLRINTFRTLVRAFTLGGIGISLNATHLLPLLLHPLSRCPLPPSSPLFLCPRFPLGTMPCL